MSIELFVKKSAIVSECGKWRYWLDRSYSDTGSIIAYFGINPSTADAEIEDQTTKKWRGFTLRNGGRKYIAVNPFAFRATDVKALAIAVDPVGPQNDAYITEAIEAADILVPCWGSRFKLPIPLRARLHHVMRVIRTSRKPVKVFGLTKDGDPMHPLMLGYDTPLTEIAQEPRP